MAFGGRYRLLGLLGLPIPHLIGAPPTDRSAVLPPPDLLATSLAASLVVGAIFWTTLGVSAGWLSTRVSGVGYQRGYEVEEKSLTRSALTADG